MVKVKVWIFSVCTPHYVMHPPITEHVPLHSKSLCKNMTRVSECANNMHPLSWGGGGGAQTEYIPNFKRGGVKETVPLKGTWTCHLW